MGEKFYHKRIKKELKKLAEISGRYLKVWIEKKVPIPHPNQELVFHYKPEAILVTKTGKRIIFEVLDDQLTDHNLIIADIIQSYLVENVSKVIFISKNKTGSEKTQKYCSIIGKILEEKGFFKKEIPEVIVYTITYSEVRSTGRLAKILKKFSKKDGW